MKVSNFFFISARYHNNTRMQLKGLENLSFSTYIITKILTQKNANLKVFESPLRELHIITKLTINQKK
jgi:hypothetical protein